MVRRLLPRLLLLLPVFAGCGGCDESADARRSAPPAKRWEADRPPEDAAEPTETPPEDAAAKTEIEPAGDPPEPAPADDPPAEPANPDGAEPTEHAKPDDDKGDPPSAPDPKTGVTMFRTDDCDEWPLLDPPPEIHIETPEVPERLQELAAPIEDD